MADINLQVGGQNKFGSFVNKDNIDNGALPTTYANLTFNNSNPEFATFEPNTNATDPESMVKAIPVAIGSGSVTATVDATYTDPGDNQQRTETKSITRTFEVVGMPHGSHLELIFP